MKRSQLIATILAVVGAGTVAHADLCAPRLQPVGELVTTRTVVSERPLYRARIIERPAPVAERITTRRITTIQRANNLEPVGEVITTRRAWAEPVAERTVMDRAGEGFARVVTAPFRIVAAPFQSYDRGPEIVGERVTTITQVKAPRKTYKRKSIQRTTTTTTRLAPVAERVVLCP